VCTCLGERHSVKCETACQVTCASPTRSLHTHVTLCHSLSTHARHAVRLTHSLSTHAQIHARTCACALSEAPTPSLPLPLTTCCEQRNATCGMYAVTHSLCTRADSCVYARAPACMRACALSQPTHTLSLSLCSPHIPSPSPCFSLSHHLLRAAQQDLQYAHFTQSLCTHADTCAHARSPSQTPTLSLTLTTLPLPLITYCE